MGSTVFTALWLEGGGRRDPLHELRHLEESLQEKHTQQIHQPGKAYVLLRAPPIRHNSLPDEVEHVPHKRLTACLGDTCHERQAP